MSLNGADRNPAPAEAVSWLWRPSRWAIAAASRRPATPSLARIRETWMLAVLGVMSKLLPRSTPDVRYVNAGTSTLRNSSKSFLRSGWPCSPEIDTHWPVVADGRRRTRHRVVAPDADP
jgi:hypothetical protein